MGQEYERETRTELHRTQTKLNNAEIEMDFLKRQWDDDKFWDKLIGIFMIIGVLLLNFLVPHIRVIKLLINFSPKIGPADITMIVIGLMFLWKGIRK